MNMRQTEFSLQYKIAVVHQRGGYLAYFFDFHCDGFGHTADEAVTNVKEQVNAILQEHGDAPFVPPKHSDMTVVVVDLPMPPMARLPDGPSAA